MGTSPIGGESVGPSMLRSTPKMAVEKCPTAVENKNDI
jgi:hypothetical protein